MREIDLSTTTQYITILLFYFRSTTRHNAGYLISIYLVGKQSPRRIQLQGFLCMAVLYAYIGYNFDSLDKYSLLGLYGLTFFFSNYGPNTTVRWKMMHSVKFGGLISCSCFLQPWLLFALTRQAKHSCSHTNLLQPRLSCYQVSPSHAQFAPL